MYKNSAADAERMVDCSDDGVVADADVDGVVSTT
jgi:hypothetical protein